MVAQRVIHQNPSPLDVILQGYNKLQEIWGKPAYKRDTKQNLCDKMQINVEAFPFLLEDAI